MKIYGIIGWPLTHSRSPEIHNAWFRKAEISAVYKKFPVKPEELADFMRDFRKNISGASVTIPHKITIMQYLDEISPSAKKIGAINTIVNKNGKLFGFNTDKDGALHALGEVTKLAGKTIILLGAGGAARAILAGLCEEGAHVTIFDRDYEKARKLAHAEKMENLDKALAKNPDIIINATPVGMAPNDDQSLINPKFLKPGMVVFDVVYEPLETKLIRDARAAGCKVITGDKMLLYQAEKQFEVFRKGGL